MLTSIRLNNQLIMVDNGYFMYFVGVVIAMTQGGCTTCSLHTPLGIGLLRVQSIGWSRAKHNASTGTIIMSASEICR